MTNTSHVVDSPDHFEGQMWFPLLCFVAAVMLDALREKLERLVKIPTTVFLLFTTFVVFLFLRLFVLGTALAPSHKELIKKYTWLFVDPDIVMEVILPILIFDSCFHMEAHEFIHRIVAILVLAVPGFLISSFIMGGLVYSMGEVVEMAIGSVQTSHWSPQMCLLFGGLTSATDPVAVVSLLEELSAPLYLKVLIDGEALLNDGAAIVLFDGLEKIIFQGQDTTVFLEVLSMTMVSAFLGYITAWILLKLMNHALHNRQEEISAVFHAQDDKEGNVEGSGVVGEVIFGLYLSSQQSQLQSETVNNIRNIWSFLALWANYVVFILSGILMAETLPLQSCGLLKCRDHILILTLGSIAAYLFSVISRILTFAIVGRIARYYQARTKKERPWPETHLWMMTWGGLRGAVALLLVSKLKHELTEAQEKDPTKNYFILKSQVVAFTVSIVFFSLMVQAGTYANFASLVQLQKRSLHRKNRMKQRLEHLREKSDTIRNELRQREEVNRADWESLDELVSRTLRGPEEDSEPEEGKGAALADGEEEEHWMEDYTNLCKAITWQQWEHGLFSRRVLGKLVHWLDGQGRGTGGAGDAGLASGLDVRELSSYSRLSQYLWKTALVPGIALTRLSRWAYPRTFTFGQDIGRLVNFTILVFDLYHLAAFHSDFSHVHISFFIHILLAFFFFMVFITGFKQQYRVLKKKGYLLMKFESVFDFLFCGVYVVSSTCIIVFFIEDDLCFVSVSPELRKWDDSKTECVAAYDVLLGITAVRSLLKLPSVFLTIASVIGEEIVFQWEAREFVRGDALVALCKITEDIHFGLIRNTIPTRKAQENVDKVNRETRRNAYRSLAELMKDPLQLVFRRLSGTKQAMRTLYHRMQQSIKYSAKNGSIDAEEHSILLKILEKRKMELAGRGLSEMDHWNERTTMENQLRRVPWISHLKPPGIFKSVVSAFVDGPARLTLSTLEDFSDMPTNRAANIAPVKPIQPKLANLLGIGGEPEFLPPNTVIIDFGSTPVHLYFLIEGICCQRTTATNQQKSDSSKSEEEEPNIPSSSMRRFIYPGSFINHSAITDARLIESPVEVKTFSVARIASVPIATVDALKKDFPQLEDAVRTQDFLMKAVDVIRPRLRKGILGRSGILAELRKHLAVYPHPVTLTPGGSKTHFILRGKVEKVGEASMLSMKVSLTTGSEYTESPNQEEAVEQVTEVTKKVRLSPGQWSTALVVEMPSAELCKGPLTVNWRAGPSATFMESLAAHSSIYGPVQESISTAAESFVVPISTVQKEPK